MTVRAAQALAFPGIDLKALAELRARTRGCQYGEEDSSTR
jgi:hypothetical protein